MGARVMRPVSWPVLLLYLLLFAPAVILLLFGMFWLPFFLVAAWSQGFLLVTAFHWSAVAVVAGTWGMLCAGHLLYCAFKAEPWLGRWWQWCGLLAGVGACALVTIAVPEPILILMMLAPIAATMHLLYVRAG